MKMGKGKKGAETDGENGLIKFVKKCVVVGKNAIVVRKDI